MMQEDEGKGLENINRSVKINTYEMARGIKDFKQLEEFIDLYIPENLVTNKKIGFGAPVDFLIKSDLKTWATDLLSVENLSKNQIQNTELIQKKLNEHLSGKKNHRDAIWNLIIFQNWMAENA